MFKIYLACLSYLVIVTDAVRSKPDYLYNDKAGGWLKLHRIPATWEEAFLRCHYEGAVLASPLNEELAHALHSQMTQSGLNGPIFLGTHGLFSNGDFVSVEGVPLSDMEIRFGNGTETGSCLTMSSIGIKYLMYTNHLASCNDPLPYICYKKFTNLTMNDCGTFDNEYHLNQRTGSCYKVHYQKRNWSTAYKICASEGGYLVILNDDEEARIVRDMFPVRTGDVNQWEQFHIGLLAWGSDRTWITIHGDRIEDVYHNWNPGQPDNMRGIQDHGTIIRNGNLDDGVASTQAKFVCEKSPVSKRFEATQPTFEENVQ